MTIKLNEDIKNVLEELKANSLVDAIAIAGSRASGNGDERSDYDVYIYSTGNEAVQIGRAHV